MVYNEIMVVPKEVKDVLESLRKHQSGELLFQGTTISFRLFDQGEKIVLQTPVFEGHDYIPPSVRKGMTSKLPIHNQAFRTYLTLDEEKFRIILNYVGNAELYDIPFFHQLLEEFTFIAEEWREFFDNDGKKDLIYVRQPKT